MSETTRKNTSNPCASLVSQRQGLQLQSSLNTKNLPTFSTRPSMSKVGSKFTVSWPTSRRRLSHENSAATDQFKKNITFQHNADLGFRSPLVSAVKGRSGTTVVSNLPRKSVSFESGLHKLNNKSEMVYVCSSSFQEYLKDRKVGNAAKATALVPAAHSDHPKAPTRVSTINTVMMWIVIQLFVSILIPLDFLLQYQPRRKNLKPQHHCELRPAASTNILMGIVLNIAWLFVFLVTLRMYFFRNEIDAAKQRRMGGAMVSPDQQGEKVLDI